MPATIALPTGEIMPGELSVAFQGDKLWEAYQRLGALAEALGFGVVSVYADLGFQPAIAPLLAIARATRRVRLGPAALNPYLLHPVEIAGQIAALDAASGGRAWLGLARGAWLDALGIDDARPLARLREAIAVIRLVLARESGGFAGSFYRLPEEPLLRYAPLRPRVPLLIGAWGPRMLELAGELADEVKIGGSANPDLIPWVRHRLAVGERRAGRAEGSVGIVVGAVTVVDLDGDAARERARQEAARYLPVVAPLDPTVVVDRGDLARMARLVAVGDDDAAASGAPAEPRAASASLSA
ncbi:MAG TPA: LLM class flavin-dependent oxidoreductase, partial [Thermomicrobiales bacterium]|nr:LLM class flavin-dependent oxidoreductase [Thermomicrobiales bacterium]